MNKLLELRATLKAINEKMAARLGEIEKDPEAALPASDETYQSLAKQAAKTKALILEHQARMESECLAREAEEDVQANQPAVDTGGRVREPLRAAGSGVRVGRDNALDRPFAGLGDQLVAVRRAAMNPSSADPRLYQAAATGMGGAVDSDGGFLVQTDIGTEILRRTYDVGGVLSRCRRIQISGNSSGIKIPSINETSRAGGSRYGGVQVYWVGEGTATTASAPKFGTVELSLNKLMGLVYVSDELLEDAMALEGLVNAILPEEMAFHAEDDIFTGTGSGQPLGILNAGALVSVAKETGQAAATLVKENIDKMWARLYTRAFAGAAWFVNQDVWPQLLSLNLAVGTGGAPVFLPPGGMSEAPFGTLYGRPVQPVEYCQTLGTKGDIFLANFGEYLLIEKGGVKSASSMHVKFLTDEMTYRFTYRLDGQPWWTAALTPLHGSNTVSPFISLDTR